MIDAPIFSMRATTYTVAAPIATVATASHTSCNKNTKLTNIVSGDIDTNETVFAKILCKVRQLQ